MSEMDATSPRIRTHPSRNGVQLVDPIQDAQFALLTDEPVGIDACDEDSFYFPVDAAATLGTDRVETPYPVHVWIRTGAGDTVAQLGADEEISLPAEEYHLDLTTTGIKVQLAVSGELEVHQADGRVTFLSDGDGFRVGVRSLHEQPAARITTTDDPADVMTALSMLGSALKTTSCERSFPTLRGHPPLVERGESLDVPDGLERPDTGVAIEVPESFEYIYPVASLAYYLGAEIRPGRRTRIVTDDWEYPLGESSSFELTVSHVLKRVFLLDCVTRTEGYYEVDLHERDMIEGAIDLDFAALYDRPLAEQLEAYMDVPHDALADALPTWKLTADVRPRPVYVSTLPFIANELAVVRCPDSTAAKSLTGDDVAEQVASIFQQEAAEPVRGDSAPTRSNSSTGAPTDPLVYPDETDSIEHAYVGEGIPIGASKMTLDAYYRRLTYEPSSDPQISVLVVCNDEQMADEDVVSDIYGAREWIEFDISVERSLTTDEMREALRADVDFHHYIGHVDADGIRCADGHLDARGLTDVNVSAFILNACDSYEQGRALVDHGAMAGIATLADVNIDLATSVGRTVARLLNQGFSLAATMNLVAEHEEIGHQYLVVGDASVSVVGNKAGTPYSAAIEEDEGSYEMTLYGYPRLDSPLGTTFTPFVPGESGHYLNTGRMDTYELSAETLTEFLEKQETPIVTDSGLTWSQDFLATF